MWFSFIYLFFAACGSKKRKKEFFGDTPNPGKGLCPLHSLKSDWERGGFPCTPNKFC